MLKYFMVDNVKGPIIYNGSKVTALETEVIEIEKIGDEYKIVPPEIGSEDFIADTHMILLPTTEDLLGKLDGVMQQEDPIICFEMDEFVSYAEVSNNEEEYIVMNIHKSIYDAMQGDIDEWSRRHDD